MAEFMEGDYVVLVDLKSDAGVKHNGSLSKVVERGDRYTVAIEATGTKLKVKPGNLRKASVMDRAEFFWFFFLIFFKINFLIFFRIFVFHFFSNFLLIRNPRRRKRRGPGSERRDSIAIRRQKRRRN